MPGPIISIDPISSVDVVLIQEDSIVNQGVTGSSVYNEIVIAGSEETITIKPILPDNIITVCCDDDSGSTPPTPTEDALSAKTLILEKIAGENISALNVLYLSSSTECLKADNSLIGTATVAGIATNGGITGAMIRILSFGIVEDPSFLFGVNDPLYLGASGGIISIAPVSGVLTKIGYGLGVGSIYIKVEKPIIL